VRATRDATASQAIAASLLDHANDDVQAVRLRGLSLVLLGRAAALQGSRARAVECFTQAHAALAGIAPTSRDYAILEPWAFALAGVGRNDEARAVVTRLTGFGYRHPLFVSTFVRTGAATPPRLPVNPR
jgi:hypothetical protein